MKAKGQSVFDSWKKIQTPESIKFIQRYEDLQSMGEKDVKTLLVRLEVELSALRMRLNR